MLESSLAPYLLWAKTRQPAAIDLAGSNLLACTLDDLPGARDHLDLMAPDVGGYPPLLAAVATHYGVPTSRVALAPGCSGAAFLAVAALVGPGDEVLIERPTYDPLIGACRLFGAVIRRFDRAFEAGYRVEPEAVRARLTPKTRLVVLTTPHNPSGARIDRATLVEIGAAAERVGAHVLVDEVYLDAANLVNEPHAYPSAASLDGPFVTINSLTKSYGLAGLRCGWAIAAPATTERLRRVRDLIDNIGAAPADRLAALAFANLGLLADRARALLSANLALGRRFFDAHPHLAVTAPPESSVAFPRLHGTDNAESFVRTLLDRHGVAVAPGSFFDAPGHFRISLAGRTEALAHGLERLSDALGQPR